METIVWYELEVSDCVGSENWYATSATADEPEQLLDELRSYPADERRYRIVKKTLTTEVLV